MIRKFSNKIIDLVGSEFITFEKYVQLFSKRKKNKIYHIDIEEIISSCIN